MGGGGQIYSDMNMRVRKQVSNNNKRPIINNKEENKEKFGTWEWNIM